MCVCFYLLSDSESNIICVFFCCIIFLYNFNLKRLHCNKYLILSYLIRTYLICTFFLKKVDVRYRAYVIVRPSVVCLSVTFVHPTQAINFR